MDDLVGISRRSAFLKLIKPPDPSLNYNKKYVKRLVSAAEQSQKTIVDIGSGGRRLARKVINVDISVFNDVNVVSDAGLLPIKNNSVDLVVITAVLEHVKQPYQVVSEIHRVLKKGGKVYVEVPFLQAFHADPMDFQRYTLNGLINLFRDFEVLGKGVCVGPFSAAAFFMRKFPTIFFHNSYFAKSVEFIVGWLVFWVKYFDWFLQPFQRLHIVASGTYLLLSKPEILRSSKMAS